MTRVRYTFMDQYGSLVWAAGPVALAWLTRDFASLQWMRLLYIGAALVFVLIWLRERRSAATDVHADDAGIRMVAPGGTVALPWQTVQSVTKVADVVFGERRERGVKLIGSGRRNRVSIALSDGTHLRLHVAEPEMILHAWDKWQAPHGQPQGESAQPLDSADASLEQTGGRGVSATPAPGQASSGSLAPVALAGSDSEE